MSNLTEIILEVTREARETQDEYAHQIAKVIGQEAERLGGRVDGVANQFGLTPALIVLYLPDGVTLDQMKGVDWTGITARAE
jgi:butyrate kinase